MERAVRQKAFPGIGPSSKGISSLGRTIQAGESSVADGSCSDQA
jgi:hypothetical protein